MKYISLFVSLGMLLCAALSDQPSQPLVWTDKGCGAVYAVNEVIIIYFIPNEGEEYELWAYDALMKAQLIAEGEGDGTTFQVQRTVEPPVGPLTFVLKMPCKTGCTLCDLCDYGQCSVQVKAQPCQGQDHCTDGVQDCNEYGIDCGGGCPFRDSDADGVEDCADECPDSRCKKVDSHGCEIDADSDGVTDCMDECPGERGDAANRGCPKGVNVLIVGIIGAVIGTGLALSFWMRGRKPHQKN